MAKLKLLKNKVLVTGANGLLGQQIVTQLKDGFEVMATGRDDMLALGDICSYSKCDITNRKETIDLIKSFKPQYIVNSAAYTNVDKAEEEKELCWRINVSGVEYLAQAAKQIGAKLVHISTDYVFDGKSGGYHEKSIPNPLGYYGRSKLAGENAILASGVEHMILRTMVLYGRGINLKPNFAIWLINNLQHDHNVRIVDDQFGHPTLADDLALAIKYLIEKNSSGTFHVVGDECGNRFDFSIKLAEIFGFDCTLISPLKTAELNQKAPRPLNSSFELDKLYSEIDFKLSGIEEGIKKLKEKLG